MTGRKEFFPSPAPATQRGEDWRQAGNCAVPAEQVPFHDWRHHDWIFFDHSAADEPLALEEARTMCTGCPSKAICLADAIAKKEPGIRAGTTEADRKQKNPVRCRKGHDLTLPGAYMRDRECRECRNARDRRARAEKAAS